MSFKSFLPGTYTVFVHNYSADMEDEMIDLTESNAVVTVYAAGGKRLLKRFPVPVSGSGVAWDVFSFNGSVFDGKEPKHIHAIQELGYRPNPETDYRQDCSP